MVSPVQFGSTVQASSLQLEYANGMVKLGFDVTGIPQETLSAWIDSLGFLQKSGPDGTLSFREILVKYGNAIPRKAGRAERFTLGQIAVWLFEQLAPARSVNVNFTPKKGIFPKAPSHAILVCKHGTQFCLELNYLSLSDPTNSRSLIYPTDQEVAELKHKLTLLWANLNTFSNTQTAQASLEAVVTGKSLQADEMGDPFLQKIRTWISGLEISAMGQLIKRCGLDSKLTREIYDALMSGNWNALYALVSEDVLEQLFEGSVINPQQILACMNRAAMPNCQPSLVQDEIGQEIFVEHECVRVWANEVHSDLVTLVLRGIYQSRTQGTGPTYKVGTKTYEGFDPNDIQGLVRFLREGFGLSEAKIKKLSKWMKPYVTSDRLIQSGMGINPLTPMLRSLEKSLGVTTSFFPFEEEDHENLSIYNGEPLFAGLMWHLRKTADRPTHKFISNIERGLTFHEKEKGRKRMHVDAWRKIEKRSRFGEVSDQSFDRLIRRYPIGRETILREIEMRYGQQWIETKLPKTYLAWKDPLRSPTRGEARRSAGLQARSGVPRVRNG